jgi:hypothetical protein
VSSSAHCRSSMTRATGDDRPRRSMTPRIVSNRRAWACRSNSGPSAISIGRSTSSGSRRASPRRPGPSRAGTRAGSTDLARVRKASTNGTNGTPRPPNSRHAPTSTRAPRSTACSAKRSSSRVLPTPASPPTTTVPPLPSAARPTAASRRASSTALPMNRFASAACSTAAGSYAVGHAAPAWIMRPRSLVLARHNRVRVAPSVRPIDRAISGPRYPSAARINAWRSAGPSSDSAA